MTPRSDPLSRLSDAVAELALKGQQTARMWAEIQADMGKLIADLKRQNGEKP